MTEPERKDATHNLRSLLHRITDAPSRGRVEMMIAQVNSIAKLELEGDAGAAAHVREFLTENYEWLSANAASL